MDGEQRERLVDQALARALAPKSIEPRDGLEDRLLANLAAQPQRRPWWRRMWVPALVAAAIIALLIGARLLRMPAPHGIESKNAPQLQQQAPAVTNVPAEQSQKTSLAKKETPRRTRRLAPHVQLASTSVSLPKQSVFPTPVPPTAEERLLLALVHRRPQQAQRIAAEQEADRQQIQKYLDSGSASGEPGTGQQMR